MFLIDLRQLDQIFQNRAVLCENVCLECLKPAAGGSEESDSQADWDPTSVAPLEQITSHLHEG